MKIVLQRVSQASVSVAGEEIGAINAGLLLLVGFTHEDKNPPLARVADKLLNLRVFDNEAGKLDRTVTDVEGALLVVPQFTLYGSTRKGRRPDFIAAQAPERARHNFNKFIQILRQITDLNIECGEFGADMQVQLCNDGPFTLLLDY